MTEIWKDITGYEGLYQVSNLGRVRSLDRYVTHSRGVVKYIRKGCVLKQNTDKGGYKYVGLYKDGKVKYIKVHRLVAQVFLHNPDNLPEVNHIDENKSNNRVDNIEWCSHKQNCNHGTRNERMSKNKLNYQSYSKPVLQYTKDGQFVAEYPSIAEAERNIKLTNIQSVLNGNRKTAGGYIWKYK